MAPGQVWWLIRAKTPKQQQQQSDKARLYRLLKEAKAKEAKNDG